MDQPWYTVCQFSDGTNKWELVVVNLWKVGEHIQCCSGDRHLKNVVWNNVNNHLWRLHSTFSSIGLIPIQHVCLMHLYSSTTIISIIPVTSSLLLSLISESGTVKPTTELKNWLQLDSVSTSIVWQWSTIRPSAVGNDDSHHRVVPQSINGCQLSRGRDGSL